MIRNPDCTLPYIHAVIVPPAIGMFIEAAGDTHKLDPDALGFTVSSCERQSLPTLPRVASFPNRTIAGFNDPKCRLQSFRSVRRGVTLPGKCALLVARCQGFHQEHWFVCVALLDSFE